MRRRDFIKVIAGSVAAWPLAARAQQPERIRHIAVLMGAGDDPQGQSWIAGFQQRLAELGWLDGRNVQVDVHWGGADIDHIRRTAVRRDRASHGRNHDYASRRGY